MINNKSYGVCRVTGKLINKDRLKLVPHATLSIEAKKAQDEASQSKSDFKDLLPEKCKQMDYDMGGNWEGHMIRVTRSKSNTLTLKHIPPKEAKDD